MLNSPKISTRKPIDYYGTTTDVLNLMSEGNAGAFFILSNMFKTNKDNTILAIIYLDDMNIRGTQICIGFEKYCNKDIEKFTEAIMNRDSNLIETINKEGLEGNHKDKAVLRGATVDNNRFLL